MSGVSSQAWPALRDFFRWWGAELSGLVPARLRRLSPQPARLVLLLDATELVLSLETATGATTLGRAGADRAERCAAVRSVLRQHGVARSLARGRMEVCLRLPAGSALRSLMELPLAAEANLAEVVAFELDRHTPFRANQAYFCHRLLARDPVAQRLRLEVVTAPRRVVDEALKAAAELGLEPDRVEVAPVAPGLPATGNLLDEGAPASRGGGLDRASWALAVIALVLAAVAVALPVVQVHRRAAVLTEEFAAARRSAETAAALRREIEGLREEVDFLVNRKSQTRSVSDLLLETTRLLPDDTWLTELRIAGGEMQIAGLTASASALVGLLERSDVFRNTTFRSPVTQDAASGRERFGVAVRIVVEGERR
jgi:general secretion pathway protein L